MDFLKLLKDSVPNAGPKSTQQVLDAQQKLEMLRVKNPQEAEIFSKQLAGTITSKGDPRSIFEGISKSYGASLGKQQTQAEAAPQDTAKKTANTAAAIANINSLVERSTKSGTPVNPELISSVLNLAQSDPEEARKIAKESIPVEAPLSVSDRIALEKRGEEKVAKEQMKEALTAKSERMVSLMKELEESEGFDSLFGFGYTGIPGSAGADSKVLYDQIQAQGFMEAIKDMRGMGALSNAEGEKASVAFTGISPSMSQKAAKKRIDEVIGYIKTGEERLKTGKLIETKKDQGTPFSEANLYFKQATQ